MLEGKEEGKDGKGGWGEDIEGGSARWHKNGGGSRPFFWLGFLVHVAVVVAVVC